MAEFADEIVVRSYQSADEAAVRRIFSEGMMSLHPVGVRIIGLALAAPITAVSVVAAAIARQALGLAWGSSIGVGAALAGTVIGGLWFRLKSSLATYVEESVQSDLANIQVFRPLPLITAA